MGYTVEPLNSGHFGDEHFCPLFRGYPFFGGRNVWTINSLSIVGGLSTLQSDHYQRYSSPVAGRRP